MLPLVRTETRGRMIFVSTHTSRYAVCSTHNKKLKSINIKKSVPRVSTKLAMVRSGSGSAPLMLNLNLNLKTLEPKVQVQFRFELKFCA